MTCCTKFASLGNYGEDNGSEGICHDGIDGIRTDLLRTDDGWQEWDFPQLLEAL